MEKVEGSDKLLRFRLDAGDGEDRQILSGIAKFYPKMCIRDRVQPASMNTLPTHPHLQPQPDALRQDVAAQFGLTVIGGYREGDPQDHGQGLAVDVMVPVGSEVGHPPRC